MTTCPFGFYKVVFPSFVTRIATLTLVPPSPKGEDKVKTAIAELRADEGVRPYLIGHLLSFRPKRNNLK